MVGLERCAKGLWHNRPIYVCELPSDQISRENGTVKDSLFKSPSTPHLITLEGVEVRDDKVLSESERTDFLKHELVIEEKVDGANLGISPIQKVACFCKTEDRTYTCRV